MTGDSAQNEQVKPFNFSEFKSIYFDIDFENLTSGTKVGSNETVTIQEIGSGVKPVLTLTMPDNTCNAGHHLLFKIVRGDQPSDAQQFRMELTVKVASLEAMGNHLAQVKVAVLQLEQQQWIVFLKLMAERQDLIDSLLQRMRG